MKETREKNLYKKVLIFLFLSLSFVSASSNDMGLGDSVKIIVNHSGNFTNSTPINESNQTIQSNFTYELGDGLNLNTIYTENNESDEAPIENIAENSTALSEEINEPAEITETVEEEEPSSLVSLIIAFLIIAMIAGTGFFTYKGVRKLFVKSDLGPSVDYIELDSEIKDKLMEYKEESWTWDEFMTRVLELIENDVSKGTEEED